MNSKNLTLLIFLVILLTSCLPDSFTKFKEDPPSKDAGATGGASGGQGGGTSLIAPTYATQFLRLSFINRKVTFTFLV